MRLGMQPLRQPSDDARFANSGLARDQHDLAVPCLGARPATQQEIDFLAASDQRAERRSAQRLEPALDDALRQYLPAAHRLGVAVGFDRLEIAAVKRMADQLSGRAA